MSFMFDDPDSDSLSTPRRKPRMQLPKLNMRLGILISSVVAILVVLMLGGSLFEQQDAGEILVIQTVTGNLNCYTDPGPKWQGFGTVTRYPRRGTYAFDRHSEHEDTGKQLQFNDGGKAKLYGSINWEMPLDCKKIIQIHRTFNSKDGLESSGVAKMVNSAVYLSGLAMSSTESAAERRGELVELINDQAQNGVHQTVTHTIERPDPVTGEKKMVAVVETVRDAKGMPKRQQGSILEQFDIHLQPLSVEKLDYAVEIEKQIQERQKATQQVQLAQANARKAEQDAITAAKVGEATAASAKWTQEAIKAKEVTKAEQELAVATLGARTAEQFKREQILRGEGEAERKRLVMAADGALDSKLEAYKAVQAAWADAFGKYGGAMVSSVNLGNGSAGGGTAMGNAQDLVQLLTARTARDLSLDLSNTGNRAAPAPAKK